MKVTHCKFSPEESCANTVRDVAKSVGEVAKSIGDVAKTVGKPSKIEILLEFFEFQ